MIFFHTRNMVGGSSGFEGTTVTYEESGLYLLKRCHGENNRCTASMTLAGARGKVQPALAIMDNFKGQTSAVLSLQAS